MERNTSGGQYVPPSASTKHAELVGGIPGFGVYVSQLHPPSSAEIEINSCITFVTVSGNYFDGTRRYLVKLGGNSITQALSQASDKYGRITSNSASYLGLRFAIPGLNSWD